MNNFDISLALIIGCSYYFGATITGRRALRSITVGLMALLQSPAKPERIHSPAVSFISGMRYSQLSALLWFMAAIGLYSIYGLIKVAYYDPHPFAHLLLVPSGFLIAYIIMGNRETLKEIKDTPWYRTQRMFDDF